MSLPELSGISRVPGTGREGGPYAGAGREGSPCASARAVDWGDT